MVSAPNRRRALGLGRVVSSLTWVGRPDPRLLLCWASVVYILIAWFWLADAIVGSASVIADGFVEHEPPFRVHNTSLPELYFSDASSALLDYPRSVAFARGIAAGRIDLWNPWNGCGMPLWAEQGGPFFPTYIPFYLWPARATYHLSLALKVVLFALGGYTLARRLGLSFGSALAAGSFLELSGSSPSLLSFASPAALCLLPWCVQAGISLIDGSRRSITWAALTIGLAFHSGHPSSIALAGLAFACGILGQLAHSFRAMPWRTFAARLGFACVVGLGLGGPRLLPGAELFLHGQTYKTSERAREVFEKDGQLGLKFLPVAVFAPSAYPELRRREWLLWPWYAGVAQSALVFILALLGLSWRRPMHVVLLGALGLWLGTAAFGLEGHRVVPGVSFLLPRYTFILAQVALSMAAGFGLEALRSPGAALRLCLGLTIFWGGSLGFQSMGMASFSEVSKEIILEAIFFSLWVATSCISILFLLGRFGKGIHVVAGIFAFLHSAVTFGPVGTTPQAASLEDPPAIVNRLKEATSRDWRIHSPHFGTLVPNLSTYFGIRDLRAATALSSKRLHGFFSLMPGYATDWTEMSTSYRNLPHLDLAAARYLAVQFQRGSASSNLFYLQPPGPSRLAVYERPSAVPRARLVFESVLARNDVEAEQLLFDALPRTSKPLAETSMANRVVVEPAPSGAEPPQIQGGSGGMDRVEILKVEDPDRVLVQTTSSQDAYLVLSDTFFPGWRAFMDGEETPIYPANLAFRAVFVPAGSHAIEFQYQPRSFWLGVLLSAFAGAVLIANRQLEWVR